MKKYSFKIYQFDEKTKKIALRGTFKTNKLSRERLDVVIKSELQKFGEFCCYEIVGEP